MCIYGLLHMMLLFIKKKITYIYKIYKYVYDSYICVPVCIGNVYRKRHIAVFFLCILYLQKALNQMDKILAL